LPIMSTFYLLPPRRVVAKYLTAALGIPVDFAEDNAPLWNEAAETLSRAVEATGAFVVYREDLPAGENPARALADGFGAEVGDEVIEVQPGAGPARRWRVPPVAA
jgi:hypothetical protein